MNNEFKRSSIGEQCASASGILWREFENDFGYRYGSDGGKGGCKRANIKPKAVDEVIVGQVGQIAECGFVARAVSLKAGMPEETTAYSVNRQCGSDSRLLQMR